MLVSFSVMHRLDWQCAGRRLASALLLGGCAPMVWALSACEAPVFACTIAGSGKHVQVCQQDQHLVYESESAQGASELRFRQPVRSVRIDPWNGVGWEYSTALEMSNGAWTYRLYSIHARGEPRPGEEAVKAGITVLRGGQQRARLTCQADTVKERIESLLN